MVAMGCDHTASMGKRRGSRRAGCGDADVNARYYGLALGFSRRSWTRIWGAMSPWPLSVKEAVEGAAAGGRGTVSLA